MRNIKRWISWLAAFACIFGILILYQSVTVLKKEIAQLQAENQTMKQSLEEIQHPKGGVQEHGRLSVNGTQLVDQFNNPVMLKGMSSHGLLWYPEYTNYRALKTLRDQGANVFRISLYTEGRDGYAQQPQMHEKLLYQAIENSLAADLYTVVDWHILKDGNPLEHIQEAKQLFTNVAKRYGDEPGIIYEICNEPNGTATYEDIYTYAMEIIPLIREYSPYSVILVGTPKFCTALNEVIENPVPYPNLMYTYHFYSEVSNRVFAQAEIQRGLDAGLGIFVSEWGMKYCDEKHMNDADIFLQYLQENKISWINWALSNKEEGYSLISPQSHKLSQWSEEDFSATGDYVISRLKK